MTVLSDKQLKNGYFDTIGGFPSSKTITTVAEYNGGAACCIACTQLEGRFSDYESNKILKDWINFLSENPKAFKALHFNSYVPQKLFKAICLQTDLTELRLKWGRYRDLTGLPKSLRYLYLGSCPGVTDITPITELKDLKVLYLENLKGIKDYSPLCTLESLEQLVISGPILGTVYINDLDFIPKMPRLRSLWLPNVKTVKKYTKMEREELHSLAPNVAGVYDDEWWMV